MNKVAPLRNSNTYFANHREFESASSPESDTGWSASPYQDVKLGPGLGLSNRSWF